jgi:hypothetical protein
LTLYTKERITEKVPIAVVGSMDELIEKEKKSSSKEGEITSLKEKIRSLEAITRYYCC